MNHIPDGFIITGHSAWDTGGDFVLAKGYDYQAPDLITSDRDQWNIYSRGVRGIMKCLNTDERLQVNFYADNDFGDDIQRYADVPCSGIVKEIRDSKAEYFSIRMNKKTLIQSKMSLYVSKKFELKRRSAFDSVFAVAERCFDQRGKYFDEAIRPLGGSVVPMDNMATYRDILRHWSPGSTPSKDPDFNQNIESLCRRGEMAARGHEGLFVDGFHLAIWTVSKMPGVTRLRIMEPFFNLTMPGLFITVNIEKLSIGDEVRHEDERAKGLLRNVKSRGLGMLPSANAGLTQHANRANELLNNQVAPFRAQIIIKMYARTADELDDKMEALRGAIDSTGAVPQRPSLWTSSLAFFNCTTPGFGPWTGYTDRSHKIYDENLSHMWPIGSTPKAELSTADWISCGRHNNLIGGQLFARSHAKDMVIVGPKGSGKSAIGQTVVLQSAHQFKVIAIIDDGASWKRTARLLDPSSEPIKIRANSGHCINPLDTKGLAGSPEHLGSATALFMLLVGTSRDEDRQADAEAIVSKAVEDLYDRVYRYWKNDHPEDHYKACVLAAAALKSKEEDFVDAVQSLKGKTLDVTEKEALAVEADKATAHYVRDAAFSMWDSSMFPTLWDLWSDLDVQRDNPKYESLANRLGVWKRDGKYGCLVDGISNIDLGTRFITDQSPLKVIHFEIGGIKNSEMGLKSVLSFLITNELRWQIQSMPRRFKKALVVEEVSSFLSIPHAADILIGCSEKMRKYMCWMLFIFQQVSSLSKANSAVAAAIINNALTLMLMRNPNLEDLKAIEQFIHLPAPIVDALMSFPDPEHMDPKDAYAGFVYVQREASRPTFTVGMNVISEREEEIINSSGDRFEEKDHEKSTATAVSGRNGMHPLDVERSPNGRDVLREAIA